MNRFIKHTLQIARKCPSGAKAAIAQYHLVQCWICDAIE